MDITRHANAYHSFKAKIGIIILIHVLALVFNSPLLAQTRDLSPGSKWLVDDKIFVPGTASLNRNNIDEVKILGKYLEQRPDLNILIQGHWDKSLSDDEALIISEARANALKTYLVKRYSIDSERIKTTGFGSFKPLVSVNGKTESIGNKRLEIISLTSYTRQPVTRDGLAVNCSAYLSLIDGSVQAKGPWDLDFNSARYQQQIYEGHKINVFFRSRSALRLKDGSLIRLYSDSRVTFNGSQHAESYSNLFINKGKVEIDLLPSVARKQFVVNLPNGNITLKGTKAVIQVETQNDSLYVLVSLQKGHASGNINNTPFDLKQGQGFTVYGTSSQPEMTALPAEPNPLLPLDNQTVSSGMNAFNWLESIDFTLFEISKKQDFKTFVIQKQTDASNIKVNLNPGTYFWRIRHIGENGLESFTSEPRRLFVTSEYISHSLVKKNISSVSAEGAMAKLDLNVKRDTLVEDKIFTIEGRTDPGSKIFIDDYQVKTQNLNGSFAQRMQLEKGKNEIEVRVRAQNGLENSKNIVVEFEPPSPFKFFIMTGPVLPMSLKNHDYGIKLYAATDYMLTQQMSLRSAFGFGGLIAQPEAYGNTGGSNGLTSNITADLGLAFTFFPESSFTPYIESMAGLMFWNRSTKVLSNDNTAIRASFTPGVGLGFKARIADQAIGLGAYYRSMQHLDEKLDLGTRNNSDTILEIRLGFWF
jgi:hypothetical protein